VYGLLAVYRDVLVLRGVVGCARSYAQHVLLGVRHIKVMCYGTVQSLKKMQELVNLEVWRVRRVYAVVMPLRVCRMRRAQNFGDER
jgi:hypothetical protein